MYYPPDFYFMLTIRLSRTGKRKQPYYRVVLQESSKDPWSPAIEILGNLDPRAERKDTVLNTERIKFWLSRGAQLSTPVHNLFVDLGLVSGEKRKHTRITAARAKKMAEAGNK